MALIGRPNVGKSTLFNRLVGRRQAITDELPGVTRDRLYGVCEWDGYELTIIDCGGIGSESEDPLWEPVAANARLAMDEADIIIYVGDSRTGLTLSDDEVLKDLRRRKKLVIVAANKVESHNFEAGGYEFYKLGYKDVVLISALAGYNVGDLLDVVIGKLDWGKWPEATPEYMPWRYGEAPHPEGKDTPARSSRTPELAGELEDSAEDDGLLAEIDGDYPFAWAKDNRPRFIPDESWRDEPVRLVFVGRQNAGKSSLTNALLKQNRALVSDLAGTTRDPLWAEFELAGQRFEVLDTAGMKRISRLKEDVDYYSLIRAEKSLRTSEIALLTIDAEFGITEQDKRVASKIAESGRAIVIVINKSDLIPEGDAARNAYEDYVRSMLRMLGWAEVTFTSATEGWGLKRLADAALRARENFHRRIDNAALQNVLREAIALNPPPIVKNQGLRFFDFRQIGNCPPAFLIEINDKRVIRQAYRRFIENTIRKHFDVAGTHVQMVYYVKRRKRSSRSRGK